MVARVAPWMLPRSSCSKGNPIYIYILLYIMFRKFGRWFHETWWMNNIVVFICFDIYIYICNVGICYLNASTPQMSIYLCLE
jgi:hypothetical protein